MLLLSPSICRITYEGTSERSRPHLEKINKVAILFLHTKSGRRQYQESIQRNTTSDPGHHNNLFKPNGISKSYQLDESFFNFRIVECVFQLYSTKELRKLCLRGYDKRSKIFKDF